MQALITLAEAGIDKNPAKRARALAAVPEAESEAITAEHRGAQELGRGVRKATAAVANKMARQRWTELAHA